MEKLRMYLLAENKVNAALPDVKTVNFVDGEQERIDWYECACRSQVYGTVGITAFDEYILSSGIVPETDILFIDDRDGHAGVFAVKADGNKAVIFMPGLMKRCRGVKEAELYAAAVKKASELKTDIISVSLESDRLTDIKVLFDLGFLPVQDDQYSVIRWEKVITELGIGKTVVLNENATEQRVIHKQNYIKGKVRIGVLGSGRGQTMMDYCKNAENAVLVAVCDNYAPGLDRIKEKLNDDSITYYSSFDEFIKHDMDAVVLANFATEHATFAVKCIKAGKHVFSEVLPVETLKEAVDLIAALDDSPCAYAYAENYCYMPGPRKMRQLYNDGVLGKFEYGEGEYLHNCEPIWTDITGNDSEHWRARMNGFYYCTHSIGPLIHITGLRPVKVSGFEWGYNDRMQRMQAQGAPAGIEMITLENGAVLKSAHGIGPSRNSIWYSIYGSLGRMETSREDCRDWGVKTLYVNCDKTEGENADEPVTVPTTDCYSDQENNSGHGGSDFVNMYVFCEKLRGRTDVDVIDFFEALEMYLPGHFAHISALNGGVPEEIPNFREKKVRELYANDTRCCTKEKAGDQLLAPRSGFIK